MSVPIVMNVCCHFVCLCAVVGGLLSMPDNNNHASTSFNVFLYFHCSPDKYFATHLNTKPIQFDSLMSTAKQFHVLYVEHTFVTHTNTVSRQLTDQFDTESNSVPVVSAYG